MSRVRKEYRQTARSTYDRWQALHPETQLSYLEFQNIIYSFNYAFRDYLLETGEKAKLPWGIGDFAVSKKRPPKTKISPKTGLEIISLPVDWKKTKEQGFKIYHLNRHTDGFKFLLKWFTRTARYKLSDVWVFKPIRLTSRLINHYIKKDKANLNKYQEWHLLE